jgi:uncharacterized RDD family membrane protein YckC
MSEDNPYAPPISDLTGVVDFMGDTELAGRWTRFVASFVDGIIGLCYGIPILYMLGYFEYAVARQQPPFLLTFAMAVLGFIGFLLVHGYLLKTNGQTVGKKLTGIRIVDLDGNLPDFAKVILLRYLPMSLVAMIPVLGRWLTLIDVLFIFRQDRRCLHDLLAATKVVKVSRLG